MFAAKYQLKPVTAAIFNGASFHGFSCLMSVKGKSLKNSVSTGIIKCFAISEVTTCVRMLSFGIDTAAQSFCHSFIALPMITLFKVSPEIRCSGESSRYCYGNPTAGSKTIIENFWSQSMENSIRSLCKRTCELVKLRDINIAVRFFAARRYT